MMWQIIPRPILSNSVNGLQVLAELINNSFEKTVKVHIIFMEYKAENSVQNVMTSVKFLQLRWHFYTIFTY